MQTLQKVALPPDIDFVVEEIVKKQFNGKLGQFEFLVKWKGYSAKHNTWELVTDLTHFTS